MTAGERSLGCRSAKTARGDSWGGAAIAGPAIPAVVGRPACGWRASPVPGRKISAGPAQAGRSGGSPRLLAVIALKVALRGGTVHDTARRHPGLGSFHNGRPAGGLRVCDDEVTDSKFNTLTAAGQAIATAKAAPFRTAIP